jgi:hypothetical protein
MAFAIDSQFRKLEPLISAGDTKDTPAGLFDVIELRMLNIEKEEEIGGRWRRGN